MPGTSTSTLAIKAAKWMSLGVGLQRGVQTAAVIVLARLLVPEDFGLVAVAILVLSFVQRIKGTGLLTALVQQRGEINEVANACFLVNGALTIGSYSLILLLSPLASRFFDDPSAGAVLAVMSLRLFPQALSAVPSALAVRELDFRKPTLIMFAEGLVSAVVSVALALLNWGPWSLVAGSIAGSTVAAILWWALDPWRPRWQLNRDKARQLIHSAVRIWSAGNLAYLIDSCSRLFIGGLLGLTQLGYYEIISRIVHTPLQSLLAIHDRVAVPAFCREHEEREMLGRWYLRLSGLMLVLSAAMAGLLFFYSGQIITVFFGPRWTPAVEPARALAVFALLFPLVSSTPVYIATGRVGLLLKFTAIRSAVTIILLWGAAHVSLVALCAAESAAVLVFAPVNFVIVARLTRIRLRAALSTLSVPGLGLVAFSVVALISRTFGGDLVGEPSLGSLLVFVSPPVAAYCAAILLRRPRIVAEGREIILIAMGNRDQG